MRSLSRDGIGSRGGRASAHPSFDELTISEQMGQSTRGTSVIGKSPGSDLTIPVFCDILEIIETQEEMA
jgi:hypothetical protein